jgi:hypothetical protein
MQWQRAFIADIQSKPGQRFCNSSPAHGETGSPAGISLEVSTASNSSSSATRCNASVPHTRNLGRRFNQKLGHPSVFVVTDAVDGHVERDQKRDSISSRTENTVYPVIASLIKRLPRGTVRLRIKVVGTGVRKYQW